MLLYPHFSGGEDVSLLFPFFPLESEKNGPHMGSTGPWGYVNLRAEEVEREESSKQKMAGEPETQQSKNHGEARHLCFQGCWIQDPG